MPTFTKSGFFFLFLLPVLFMGCAGGGGRAGSEIPVATTNEPLPQRQTTVQNPNTQGIAASRSEPIIYDYPGTTRNLNAPAPSHSSTATPVTGTSSKPLATAAAAGTRFHTVQSGDTLWGLSKKYSVSIDAIRSANAMTTDVIKPGQTLKIP